MQPAPGYGKLLPNAPNLHPSDFEMWFFLFWAGALVVVIALPWAFMQYRKGNHMPALCLAGGLACSIQEPMWDHLGHLRWAEALPDAFSNFGLDVPVLIPPCYMLFFGLEVFFIFTMLNRGITRKDLALLFVACGITDAIMEHPGLLMGIYEYYGNGGPQPFDFGNKFPFYWSIVNSAGFMAGGVMCHYLWPKLKGKGWKELIIIAIPPVGMMVGYSFTAWPVFLAINANISVELQWILGGGGCVIGAIGFVYLVAELVCVEESDVEWTLWNLFKARFMLPAQRERFYESGGKTTKRQPKVVASTTTK
ncbi:hypothetical protein [Paraconexibacter sp. AEG42_29]